MIAARAAIEDGSLDTPQNLENAVGNLLDELERLEALEEETLEKLRTFLTSTPVELPACIAALLQPEAVETEMA